MVPSFTLDVPLGSMVILARSLFCLVGLVPFRITTYGLLLSPYLVHYRIVPGPYLVATWSLPGFPNSLVGGPELQYGVRMWSPHGLFPDSSSLSLASVTVSKGDSLWI
jgi:hypothetical protein